MVLSDNSKGDIGWKKYLVAGWAFMECLLFGGLLYGWGSLVFVLKQEGIYADLCPKEALSQNASNASVTYNQGSGVTNNGSIIVVMLTTFSPNITMNTNGTMVTDGTKPAAENERCVPQDEKMALCFTIASAVFCAGCAVMGHINYMFGTRATRIIAFLCYIAGALMLAFVSVERPWLIYPGLSLIGVGGLPLLVTNTQVANLFVKGSSSVVGLLCGGFDMSSAVQLVVKLAHQGGFARSKMYFVITGLHSLTLVSTFGFLPKKFISRPETPKIHKEVAESGGAGVELLNGEKNPGHGDELMIAPLKSTVPSLQSCVKQPLFITHCIWLCLLQLRFYYFIGALNTYLNRILDRNEELVSYFNDVCFYTMMGGLLSSFLSGIVYDWQKKRCKKGQSKVYRELMPAVLPLSIASLLSVILSILTLIPVRDLMYLIFIVMTIYRSFLYSMAAAFLGAVFPSEYFGLLYGIMIISGGVFGFLQFAFFRWSEVYLDAPLHADICLLVLVLFSFVHPVYIWLKCWREERKFSIN